MWVTSCGKRLRARRRRPSSKQKARRRRALNALATRSPARETSALLDLGFLVGHVLAGLRVELAHFHLVRMQTLVLGRGVEVAGAGGGHELDLFAHGLAPTRSDRDAFGAQFGNDDLDALLFDGAQAAGRHAQADEAALALDPETLHVQVGQEAATTLVVGV